MTTSVGVSESTACPPAGDCRVGVASVGVTVTTAAAACVKVIVVPPIERVPVRTAPVFGAIVYCTVPLPVPVRPCEMVMKLDPLAAVHAHVAVVETVTLPAAPAAGTAVVT